MLTIFAVTLFVSSSLLFVIQPMIAKILLPLLGGAPVVWNTCMVFFQAMLLAGYVYAHVLSKLFGPRRQLFIHLTVLILVFAVLPVGLPQGWAPDATANPVPWLIVSLLVSVGAPFFAVSTTAPLLQHWFAHTGHASAHDPYFLYAVSNLGGLLALLSYPVLVEPLLTISGQRWGWSGGYIALVALIAGCALFVARSTGGVTKPRENGAVRTATGSGNPEEPPSMRQRAHWLVLAFVPSSLLLGVTSYLTTDIAAFPLLWVAPLALYLTTFVLVFARRPVIGHARMVQLQPFLVLPLIAWLYWEFDADVWQVFLIHLAAFFAFTMVCHGQLARSRPAVGRLTEFYLWMSAGGILGGLFNALLAPLLFDSIVEYPLVVALACLLRPRSAPLLSVPRLRRGLPLIGAAALAGVLVFLEIYATEIGTLGQTLGLIAVGTLCYGFAHRPIWFAAAVSVVLVAGSPFWVEDDDILYQARSYFGVHQVARDENFHVLYNGTTEHGAQNTTPGRRLQTSTYFAPSGPVGQTFDVIPAPAQGRTVAVIGLGAGTIACHGAPGENWTFFEIDPIVEQIARDPRYFTFLRDCPPKTEVVLGDARLSVGRIAGAPYDMIFMDAFSSDSVPVHLITKEAVALYLSKLAEGGVVLVNITNRYIDLQPVLGDIAEALGLVALVRVDDEVSEAEAEARKSESDWVILARRREDLAGLDDDERWQAPRRRPGSAVWTDDFSNVFGALYMVRTAFAARGTVVSYPSGCDYFIVETSSGYALLEWFGGNDPSEGDVVVGDYESYGIKDIFNVSRDTEIRVWVEEYWLSKDNVFREYRNYCR